jgi:hypothetical protein
LTKELAKPSKTSKPPIKSSVSHGQAFNNQNKTRNKAQQYQIQKVKELTCTHQTKKYLKDTYGINNKRENLDDHIREFIRQDNAWQYKHPNSFEAMEVINHKAYQEQLANDIYFQIILDDINEQLFTMFNRLYNYKAIDKIQLKVLQVNKTKEIANLLADKYLNKIDGLTYITKLTKIQQHIIECLIMQAIKPMPIMIIITKAFESIKAINLDKIIKRTDDEIEEQNKKTYYKQQQYQQQMKTQQLLNQIIHDELIIPEQTEIPQAPLPKDYYKQQELEEIIEEQSSD